MICPVEKKECHLYDEGSGGVQWCNSNTRLEGFERCPWPQRSGIKKYKYDVIFQSDNQPENFAVIACGLTSIAEAREARRVSGDIVVFHNTMEIVSNTDWLWDWEMNCECYAIKRIRMANASHKEKYFNKEREFEENI